MLNQVKSLFFLIVIGLCFSAPAQEPWYKCNWDDISPSDFGNLHESIYNFNIKKYKESIYIGKFYEQFSKEHAASANFDVVHGNFYKSLNGYENYIRKVLDEVIRDSSVTKHIKIFFYRDEEMNASMDGSGILRLNIGLFSKLKNEAELAMLIGHEVSHFLNDDAVKNYGRRIEMVYNPLWYLKNVNAGGVFLTFINNPMMQFMSFSREQEGAADFTALQFLKKTNYSLRSASNLFKAFKNNEIRWRIMYGKNDKRYNSHPDPGDRIKQVKLLSSDSLNKGRKNFIVDSVSFLELKKICSQETANLFIENFKYDDLIDLCFAQYLFEPNDKHNLALLLDGISRKINIDKKIGDKPFILSRYQTKYVKESANYEFLNSPTPTILKYLTKGFIDVTKDDLRKIKATDLLDSSTVKFTTYSEALNYFEKKAEEISCLECTHHRFYAEKADNKGLADFLKENKVFETADYLKDKSNPQSFTEDIFVLYLTDITQISSILNRKTLEQQMQFYDTTVMALKSKLGAKVYKLGDMKYKDQHMIAGLAGLCDYYTENKLNIGIKKKNEDWVNSYPELYSFFKRNNAKNLYVFDFNLYIDNNKKAYEMASFYKISLPDKKGVTFCSDLKNNSTTVEEGIKWFLNSVVNQSSFFYTNTK